MKMCKEEQLKLLKNYPKKVVDIINETICILNDRYGIDRDVGVYNSTLYIASSDYNIFM